MSDPTSKALERVRAAMQRYTDSQAGLPDIVPPSRIKRRARKPESEAAIQAEILRAIRRRDDCWIVRNTVGAGRYASGGVVVYGLGKGSADLVGLVAGGRFVGLEVKSAAGRVSPEQQRWIDKVLSLGGYACVVRSVAEAVHAIEVAKC